MQNDAFTRTPRCLWGRLPFSHAGGAQPEPRSLEEPRAFVWSTGRSPRATRAAPKRRDVGAPAASGSPRGLPRIYGGGGDSIKDARSCTVPGCVARKQPPGVPTCMGLNQSSPGAWRNACRAAAFPQAATAARPLAAQALPRGSQEGPPTLTPQHLPPPSSPVSQFWVPPAPIPSLLQDAAPCLAGGCHRLPG